ncbi:MAG: chemotaxis protein CheW [Burkholderiales bacterium]|nr:chemotaxis protein CheW [Burkholderiales bacterium]
MNPNTSSSSSQPALDMSQFFQVFFDEAAEHLDNMEQLLLAMDVEAPDAEDLNAIFRAAHSIKGGSSTFGFGDMAEVTHELESLLDRVRKNELKLTRAMVDAFLSSGDVLSAMLAKHRGQGDGADPEDIEALIKRLKALSVAPVAGPAGRRIAIECGPFENGLPDDESARLSAALLDLGLPDKTVTVSETAGGLLAHIETLMSNAEIMDALAFVVAPDKVAIRERGPKVAAAAPKKDDGFGFFDDEPAKPTAAAAAPADSGFGLFTDVPAPQANIPSAEVRKAEAKPARKMNEKANAAADSSSIRVGVDKVDQLINLVGELVITQAMLSQKAAKLDPMEHEQLLAGMEDLSRNTRDLQESVMSIRMLPMSFVFNRFPRMLRDLATKLGKEVELKTFGEQTELDKGVIEKITDPMTHLVRNSLDHGIEMPDVRVAAGKPAAGTLTLKASHQGGNIVIEVQDDGAGLKRERILSKARERGLDVSDSMSDQEVWQLIFEPGFSTADKVTDVSGRGVGMDVVKRNIQALGGSVELDSAPGMGTRVIVRLPLTLAIMDGMSVGSGGENYIIPLNSVVELLQASSHSVKSVAGTGRVVDVRNEFLPVVDLRDIFDTGRTRGEQADPVMVIVEVEGVKTALMVDELLGQFQVVVKNLESNYRKVPGVSGATILGDGTVALILDVPALVRLAKH